MSWNQPLQTNYGYNFKPQTYAQNQAATSLAYDQQDAYQQFLKQQALNQAYQVNTRRSGNPAYGPTQLIGKFAGTYQPGVNYGQQAIQYGSGKSRRRRRHTRRTKSRRSMKIPARRS